MVVYLLDEDQNKYNYEAKVLYNWIDQIKYFFLNIQRPREIFNLKQMKPCDHLDNYNLYIVSESGFLINHAPRFNPGAAMHLTILQKHGAYFF